jgi:hypothetical protein
MYEDTNKHLKRSVSNRRMRPERVLETTQHTKETRMKVNISNMRVKWESKYVSRMFESVQRSFDKL